MEDGSNVMTNGSSKKHEGIVIHKSLIKVVPTDKFWLQNLTNFIYLALPWNDSTMTTIIDSYIRHVIHHDG